MDNIYKINEKFNFKINVVNDRNIIIDSGLDEWNLELVSGNNINSNVILKHKNSRRKTNHYHVQGVYPSIEKALMAISSHESRLKNTKKLNGKVFQLLEYIKTTDKLIQA